MFWFFGNLALSSLVLESLNPQNISKFAGCLIGFHSRLVVNFTDLKCGKGKSIEAFEFAVSLHLWAFRVQNLLCC
ncbi:hypothetical protein FWP29_25060 [Vibrio parahaemolyticus]|nr:hypothetical protein [Vibrio parahaemolyticus]EGQ9507896.1 hypothetical protein [Vibrio parahaemolyticus]EGQ9814252.1 hypothetical protein [Vibrio parahaemolyticus]EGQ9921517.1 hypothetical protein [Vibrio parahaemolyticus]EGR0045901.1 hypothetical protein [Vibrio parahaemolyticus]